MKELSIEQRAEAYNEALDRARKELQACGSLDCDVARQIFRLFPELQKESEDERIRKALLNTLRYSANINESDISKEQMIAWLEKQGEQKPADKAEPKFRNGQWIVWQDKCYKVNYNGCGYELVDQNGLSTSLEYGTIDENAHLWTIQDAKDGDVLATLDYILIFKEFLKNDGGISYCHYDFGAGNPQFIWSEDKNWYFGKEAVVHPATKEQRDTLLKAMTDSGFTFDFEKKELKRVEHKVGDTIYYNSFGELKSMIVANVTTDSTDNPMYEDEEGNAVFEKDLVEKNTAWSEEDKDILYNTLNNLTELKDRYGKDYGKVGECIEWLKSLKERVQPQPKQEWSEQDVCNIQDIDSVLFYDKNLPEDTCMRLRNWLESLRPQNKWKPSDEQIMSLRWVLNHIPYDSHKEEISGLLEKLKKLSEE